MSALSGAPSSLLSESLSCLRNAFSGQHMMTLIVMRGDNSNYQKVFRNREFDSFNNMSSSKDVAYPNNYWYTCHVQV